MTEPLRVLIVEDSESDSDLIIRHLEKASYQVESERIDSAEQMTEIIKEREWDLVISDFNLPTFDALSALAILQASGQDIPFIVVSGTIGEETAVSLMKAGAHDYLMKDHLARLVPAIKRELADAQVRREHRQAQEALEESQTRYRLLFDQSPFGVLLIDPDSTCPIDFNYRAHTQLGYTREEFTQLPRSAYELEEDRVLRSQKAKDANGEWTEYNALHRTKSGELRNVDVTVRKMVVGGAQVLHCVYNDVTERKRIETSFHQSEQQFQTLTDLLPVGVYRTDENGKCVYTNQKWLDMAGMTFEEASGDGWLNAIHPEDKDQVLENWQKMIEARGAWGQEYRFQTLDGRISWVQALGSELVDEQGRRLGFIGADIDITNRRAADEALRESESKFRSVFLNSGVAISLADLEGHFFNCNPAVTRILGFSPEDYARLTISTISHPDDRLRNETLYRELLEGKRESFTMEKRNRHKDGHYVWGQLTSSLVRDGENNPLFTIGMFEDITERKKSEEALRQFARELQEAYDATLQGWSDALEMRERETAGHSRRVVELTLDLARAAGIDNGQIIHVERGALLHDIGKMGIPDSILLKPGPLSEDEWVVMRQHPIYAYRLLSHIPYLRPALDIPYCHHERWDGSGYPQGLAGEAIPLPARLFAVIDVWDALSSDRPYRPAWTPGAILSYIENQSGKQFDPEIVKLFFQIIQNRKQA